MNALVKSLAVSVLLTGTACIASFATEMSANPPPVLAAPGMTQAARAALPSAVALEIELKDGRKQQASAFVYRADGLLMTAAHIAETDVKIRVTMPDGRRIPAKTVARDVLSDVALLRIDAGQPLVAARFAQGVPEAGERVAAIGNPLGYSRSFTAGVISASARPYGTTTPYDYIQHDAALNPGNSGGPLVNSAGEVVGMNVAIADGARHNVGIGFAVPAPVLMRIAETLLKQGEIVRPVAGLRLREARELASDADGAAVEQVEAGSPAEKAGMRPGMIIVRAGGLEVRTPRDLARAMEPLAVGDELQVSARQGEDTAEFALRLASPNKAARSVLTRALALSKPHVASKIALSQGTARIDAVAPGSAAAQAGLRRGDTILAVGMLRVDDATAEAALKSVTGERLTLLIQRDGISRYIVIGEQGRLDLTAPFGSNAEAMDSAIL